MNDESSRTSPLEDAIAFIEEQDDTYTVEALYDALIDAGYPSEVANEAIRHREESRSPEVAGSAKMEGASASEDQRSRAALGLIGGAVIAWLACAVILAFLSEEGLYGGGGIGLMILALVMGLVLLLALLAAAVSDSLARGVPGALMTFLIIPFVILFGLAGTCVVIMAGITG